MLVTMFTVVGVALVGRAFLRVPLSWALPPAAALMIGGSAMVLVPNIKVSLVMHWVCRFQCQGELRYACGMVVPKIKVTLVIHWVCRYPA